MNSARSLPVVHVTEDMAAISGGVPAVVRQLATRWAHTGQAVTVLHAKGDASDIEGIARVVRCVPSGLRRVWGHSGALQPALRDVLVRTAASGGLLHIHGLWTAPPTLAANMAAAHGVPSLFTAHGMLVPWLWNAQGAAVRLKKQLFWRLFGAASLHRCTLVHAITPMERDELRALLPGARIEVIPNAIDLAPAGDSQPRQPVVLFLGRIEPKKGVDILVRAFAAAGLPRDWRLDIAGPSWSDSYLAMLKTLVRQGGIENRVRFLGPVFGPAKEELLAQAWVMAAPSHSEVVGLVNLEAGARCLPSITTRQTGLWDWEQGGGCLVEPDVQDLARALRAASAWSDSERAQRGLASRDLVARRYSWSAVMPQWRRLYEHMTQKG
jgi:glycosyltransferase involved in cell wall biosynthesis